MCGQCGIILGKKRRTRKELEALGNMFTSLLQYNVVVMPQAFILRIKMESEKF